MEKHYEIIKRILDLLETIEEGIIHTQNQIEELRYEEIFAMLQDIIEGVHSIENAIGPILKELPGTNILDHSMAVKESIEAIINSYRQGYQNRFQEQITQEMYPVFMKWKEEIQQVLSPYFLA